MAYVTLTTFKAYIQNERTGTANDDRLQAALDAAHQGIDNWCARKFAVASGSSARVYRPAPGSRMLWVHDCTTITSVVEDGTTLASGTDFQPEPLNGITAAGESVPYDCLRRLGYQAWWYEDDEPTVTVTASWGWAAIPSPVVEACKLLAKDIATAREVQFGDVAGFGEFGAVRIRSNPQVAALIAPYRRAEAVGIA